MAKKPATILIPFLLTSAGAGLILFFLAPYGSDQLPLASRFLFWLGLCAAGGLSVIFADFVMERAGYKPVKVISAFIRSLAATAGVFAVMLALKAVSDVYYTGPPALLLFYVFIISFTICFVVTFIKSEGGPAADSAPAILQRIKPALRSAEIYALGAEDHYVRVITSKGEDLILMRFRDAVKETSPLPGLSPHRSWWVAQAGVKSVQSGQGKQNIVLANDLSVPVSRRAGKLLKEAGWR